MNNAKALNLKPLNELVELISRDEIKPSELLEDCIRAIENRESEVQAFEFLDLDTARKQARQLDNTILRSELFGIPVGIKDIISTRSMRTTMGSPIYSDFEPRRDATIVSQLRSLGAVIPGKTVSTEFAYFYPGKTKNPRNLKHTPGGSSMGSAAAVADCMLPYAIGTQTAGSVIRPAAYCGVVGYKASHGEFSLEGVTGLSQSLDSLGFFVRELQDIVKIRTSLLRSHRKIETASKSLTVGLARTPHWHQLDKAQKNSIESAAEQFSRNGAIVEEIEIGPSDGALTEAHITVMAFEASMSLQQEYRESPDMLSEQLINLIEDGLNCSHCSYIDALNLADEWQLRLSEIFNNIDVILVPSALGGAPKGHDRTGDPIMSRMWTLLKVPSITIPYGTDENQLPIGIQIVGPHRKDDQLVHHAIELSKLL